VDIGVVYGCCAFAAVAIGVLLWRASRIPKVMYGSTPRRTHTTPPPGIEPTWTPPPPPPPEISPEQAREAAREERRLYARRELAAAEKRQAVAEMAAQRREEWIRFAASAGFASADGAQVVAFNAARVADDLLKELDKRSFEAGTEADGPTVDNDGEANQ
jgi:hypothetical protein